VSFFLRQMPVNTLIPFDVERKKIRRDDTGCAGVYSWRHLKVAVPPRPPKVLRLLSTSSGFDLERPNYTSSSLLSSLMKCRSCNLWKTILTWVSRTFCSVGMFLKFNQIFNGCYRLKDDYTNEFTVESQMTFCLTLDGNGGLGHTAVTAVTINFYGITVGKKWR